MKKKFSSKEKKAYFAKLRFQWQKAKELSESRDFKNAYLAMLAESPNFQTSEAGFSHVYSQMQKLGFDGLPYVDCKTFHGWRDSGFRVKSGEKSKIRGITWISAETKEDKDNSGDDQKDEYVFPKVYNLFHKSQVEPI